MSGGTNTTTSQTQPPQQFLNAYDDAVSRAQQVGNTPYQQYSGNLVAPFSPDQLSGISATRNLSGIANPFINSASQYISNSTSPLIDQIPTLDRGTLGALSSSGINNLTAESSPNIANTANAGAAGIMGAANSGIAGINKAAGSFTPGSISQFESPYINDVVNATQKSFDNQNAQTNQKVIGNAISSGAWGGDRAGVAQGIAAGQEQLAQAPVIAGLYNSGFQNATQAAETAADQGLRGATSAGGLGVQGANQAGTLGLSGATSQAGALSDAARQQLGLYSGQQGTELSANQANAWLNSQAGYGMSSLGNQALNAGLSGANAELGIGSLEQQQAQQSLNVPYQQYTAQQAYPFQTAGWLANIEEGLGGASGGTSSTTSPAPNAVSQIGGGLLAGTGILGATGGFGKNGYLSGLFSGDGGFANTPGGLPGGGFEIPSADGGAIPHFAPGGGIAAHRAPGGNIPDVSVSFVPGADGLGSEPLTHGTMDILKNYGQTSTTQSDPGIGGVLGPLVSIAGIASKFLPLLAAARGGGIAAGANDNDTWHEPIRHRAMGGIAAPMLPEPNPNTVALLGPNHTTAPLLLPSAATHNGGIAPVTNYLSGGSGINVSTGAGTSSTGSPALDDYLNSVAASASHVAPTGYKPPPAAKSDDASIGVPLGGGMNPDNQASIGGGNARGGIVARDGGGDIPDDSTGSALSPEVRALLTPEPPSSGGIARAATSGSLPPSLSGISQAIRKIEGPGVSVQGANEGIMPATFKQYARDGEDISDPSARAAVHDRIISDLAQKANGDPARIAVGYFSGPGNIAPPDSPTPWLHDRKDALGTSVSGYVAKALGMIGHGGPEVSADAPPTGDDQYSFATTSRPAGGIADGAAPTDRPLSHDPWGTLLTTGLGIMAGTSPNAGVNIGRGGLQGVQYAQKQAQTDELAAERRATQASTEQARQETVRSHLANEDHAAKTLSQAAETARLRLAEEAKRADTPTYTSAPVSQPDPDNPGKFITGVLRSGSKDPKDVQFIRTDTNPNKAPPAGGEALTPEAIKSMAKQGNNGDYSWTTGLGRVPGAMVSVRNEMDRQMREDGKTPEEISRSRQFFAGATKAVSAFDSGSQGNATRALNVGVAHIGSLEELVPALQNGNTQVINRINNWFKTQTGSAAPTNFDAVRDIAGDEIVKAALGAGVSGALADREEIRHRLSRASSPEQLAGAIAEYKNLLGGQMRGLRQQYESSTGLHDFDKKLFPETIAALQRATPQAKAQDTLSGAQPPAATAPIAPARPSGVPIGSAYSPSRNQWRGPDGALYPGSP